MANRSKKELSPEDFLTRSERVKQMILPETDANRLIVKPNNEALGFRFNCYNEDVLGKFVDKLTFDTTVKQANKICEDVWRKKKCEEEAEYSKGLKYVLYVAIALSLIAFILLLDLIYGGGGDGLLYGAIVLITFSGVLTIVVVIKSMFSHPHFIVLEDLIIKLLDEFLTKENALYNKMDLHWKMQEKFYWLELQILAAHRSIDVNDS